MYPTRAIGPPNPKAPRRRKYSSRAPVVGDLEVFCCESRVAIVIAKGVFCCVAGAGHSLLTQLIKTSLEPGGQFFGGSASPVVEEDDHGLLPDHVVVNRHNIKEVLAEGAEDRTEGRLRPRNAARTTLKFHRLRTSVSVR